MDPTPKDRLALDILHELNALHATSHLDGPDKQLREKAIAVLLGALDAPDAEQTWADKATELVKAVSTEVQKLPLADAATEPAKRGRPRKASHVSEMMQQVVEGIKAQSQPVPDSANATPPAVQPEPTKSTKPMTAEEFRAYMRAAAGESKDLEGIKNATGFPSLNQVPADQYAAVCAKVEAFVATKKAAAAGGKAA